MFSKWETKIFSRFTFINDMIAENDKLDREILQAENDIAVCKDQMDAEEEMKIK